MIPTVEPKHENNGTLLKTVATFLLELPAKFLKFENSIAGKKARIIHLTLVPMEFQAHIIICTVMHLGLDCCHEI